jgi:hypothetical protein
MGCEKCERTERFPKRNGRVQCREASEETIFNIADFAFPKRNALQKKLAGARTKWV